jgi:hypothetical protein
MKTFLLLIFSISFTISISAQDHAEPKHKSINTVTLKKGYILVLKETDTMDYAWLKHGKEKIGLYTSSHDLLFIGLEMDGSNYFMMGAGGHGSGNPLYLDVFRKDSGTKVFSTEGFILFQDTLKSIIVFDDGNKNNGYFTLYNLNTNKYELYKEPADNPCFSYHCWDSVSVTYSTLKVLYHDTANKARTVEYTKKRN